LTKYNVYLNQDQGNKWTASYWIAAVSKWVHYTILGDKDGNLIDSEHPLDVRPSLPTGASTSAKQDALAALVGEVQADPTENTVLERLKVLETELVDIKSTSGVKKITDAVDVSDKAERELGVVTLGGSLASDVTFHNAATVAAVGSEFTVPAGYKDLTVKVMGTATSCQVQFEGLAVGASTYEPIMGVRALDFACSTLADQTGESWYVPIGGFDKVRMNLVAVAGGNVTVKGRATP